MSPTENLDTAHGPVGIYVATPTTPGPWPGVVVVHDVFGLTADAREQADWLATAGFLAAAPDLYAGGRPVACVVSTFRALSARSGRPFDDIDATARYLSGRHDCTGRVGVIGFCMGGAFALLTAAGHQFAVSAVNYGAVPDDVNALVQGACPVVASFGAKDRSLKGAAERLENALQAAGVDHDVKEYPEAGHGFMNNHRRGLPSVTRRIPGLGWHGPSAEDARERIVAFFGEHLAG